MGHTANRTSRVVCGSAVVARVAVTVVLVVVVVAVAIVVVAMVVTVVVVRVALTWEGWTGGACVNVRVCW